MSQPQLPDALPHRRGVETVSRQDAGLRREFRSHLPRLHWVAIETGMTAPGTPDSNFCGDGVEAWVEHKRARAWEVDLDPLQIGWHLRRARAGGRTFVAVRRKHGGGPRRGDPADELWLLRGDLVKLYAGPGGLSRAAACGAVLGTWYGGPSRWDWPAVEACLLAGGRCAKRPVKTDPERPLRSPSRGLAGGAEG